MNFHFSKKKLLLLGFLFAVLLVIPLTVYLVQQQQNTKSQATPNTTLSFTPSTKTAQVGDKISFDIFLSPGNNQVNFVKLILNYDSTKLSASTSSFEVNPASPLSILQGPVMGTDTLSVSLTIGSDPTKVIQTNTKIGTVSFDVIAPSELPTEITFTGTDISSINGGNQDAFNENVFLSGDPAIVTIQGGETATPSPSLAPSTISPIPTATPSPGPGVNTQDGSGDNEAPICSALGMDVSASGEAPYTINFTASGTDTDGTISKVAFNFGEGSVEEITTGGGIGTDTVESTIEHTYETAGNFTASAVITDNEGGSSDSVNCTTTITIADATGTTTTDDTTTDDTTTTTTTDLSVTPSPLPATGPAETMVGAGVLGGILLLIGTLLFFAL